MRLYSGMSRNFIEDTVRNQIAGKLEAAASPLDISHASATFQRPVTAPQSHLTDSAGDPESQP